MIQKDKRERFTLNKTTGVIDIIAKIDNVMNKISLQFFLKNGSLNGLVTVSYLSIVINRIEIDEINKEKVIVVPKSGQVQYVLQFSSSLKYFSPDNMTSAAAITKIINAVKRSPKESRNLYNLDCFFENNNLKMAKQFPSRPTIPIIQKVILKTVDGMRL